METRKRKPLSDLTNSFKLTPTSTLGKLVASKPSNSNLKSNPSSRTEKLCSDSDTQSRASIGSSNVSAAWNSHTVQLSTDSCRPLMSNASPGNLFRRIYLYMLFSFVPVSIFFFFYLGMNERSYVLVFLVILGFKNLGFGM